MCYHMSPKVSESYTEKDTGTQHTTYTYHDGSKMRRTALSEVQIDKEKGKIDYMYKHADGSKSKYSEYANKTKNK